MSRSLDFSHVSREIRNLVSRRRELMLFLGSLFAAMSLYLGNVLEGKLPSGLAEVRQSAFLTYSLVMLVPVVVIAIRFAKLHAGMVINGVFHSRIVAEVRSGEFDPKRAGRLNWVGVSTQLCLLTNLLAGFEAALFAHSLTRIPWVASVAGLAVFAALFLAFRRFHANAARFALQRIEAAPIEPTSTEEIEDHTAASLEDCNHDMLAIIAFVGLVLFSVFESLSGLGAINNLDSEIAVADLQRLGPIVYSLLLWMTNLVGVVVYLRLAVALGLMALELDPTDQPFRPLKLTDSFLGYATLAFFLAVSTHVLVVALFAVEGRWAYGVDGSVLIAALVAYPITLWRCRPET